MWVIAVGLPASGRCHQNELVLCSEFNLRIVQFYLLTTQTILSHACNAANIQRLVESWFV